MTQLRSRSCVVGLRSGVSVNTLAAGSQSIVIDNDQGKQVALSMRKHAIYLLILLLSLTSSSCLIHSADVNKIADEIYNTQPPGDPLPPNPFRSDGCSCWPDGDWVECCVEHDLPYWKGGTREARKDADLRLRECVSEKGHPIIGAVMFLGVRLGGVWWLPTPFRWGFGWDYPESGPPGIPY
jgi:hypothetical protein